MKFIHINLPQCITEAIPIAFLENGQREILFWTRIKGVHKANTNNITRKFDMLFAITRVRFSNKNQYSGSLAPKY